MISVDELQGKIRKLSQLKAESDILSSKAVSLREHLISDISKLPNEEIKEKLLSFINGDITGCEDYCVSILNSINSTIDKISKGLNDYKSKL